MKHIINSFDENYLANQFWTAEKIGTVPVFPVLEIDFNDGDTINRYVNAQAVASQWSHALFENHISEEYPTYFIDSELNLFILAYHKEEFVYPHYQEKVEKNQLIEWLKKCEICELEKYETQADSKAIWEALMKGEIRYEWQER